MQQLTSRKGRKHSISRHAPFFIQYLLHPRSVGAVKPSSPFLAEKMLSAVRFDRAACIVELGAGTGVFTEQIVKRLGAAQFLVFEVNRSFCKTLRQRYAHLPNVHIIHDSAEHLGDYLRKYHGKPADAVISGLPFASLPADVSNRILAACAANLKPCAPFITFQYTLLKRRLIGQYFPLIQIRREYRNLPPAYIFVCRQVCPKSAGNATKKLKLHSEAIL